MCFDQPYSVDFDVKHPGWFPNSLDLALVNNALSAFQMGVGLLWFRFMQVPILVMAIATAFLQYGVAALTQIPSIAVKLVALWVVSYALLFYGAISFRSVDSELVLDDKDHAD
jgi:hypothetical protein